MRGSLPQQLAVERKRNAELLRQLQEANTLVHIYKVQIGERNKAVAELRKRIKELEAGLMEQAKAVTRQ
jgi:hypothetical protein